MIADLKPYPAYKDSGALLVNGRDLCYDLCLASCCLIAGNKIQEKRSVQNQHNLDGKLNGRSW